MVMDRTPPAVASILVPSSPGTASGWTNLGMAVGSAIGSRKRGWGIARNRPDDDASAIHCLDGISNSPAAVVPSDARNRRRLVISPRTVR
jgi:hypothetical protein